VRARAPAPDSPCLIRHLVLFLPRLGSRFLRRATRACCVCSSRLVALARLEGGGCGNFVDVAPRERRTATQIFQRANPVVWLVARCDSRRRLRLGRRRSPERRTATLNMAKARVGAAGWLPSSLPSFSRPAAQAFVRAAGEASPCSSSLRFRLVFLTGRETRPQWRCSGSRARHTARSRISDAPPWRPSSFTFTRRRPTGPRALRLLGHDQAQQLLHGVQVLRSARAAPSMAWQAARCCSAVRARSDAPRPRVPSDSSALLSCNSGSCSCSQVPILSHQLLLHAPAPPLSERRQRLATRNAAPPRATFTRKPSSSSTSRSRSHTTSTSLWDWTLCIIFILFPSNARRLGSDYFDTANTTTIVVRVVAPPLRVSGVSSCSASTLRRF